MPQIYPSSWRKPGSIAKLNMDPGLRQDDGRAKPILLFDLDGTLLDTAPEFAYTLNLMLASRNQAPISIETLRSSITDGTAGMIKTTFGYNSDHPEFATLRQELLNTYDEHLGCYTQPFEGVNDLLNHLTAENIRWGIVTNKPKRFSERLISRFPWSNSAACIISGDSAAHGKPYPDTLLLACQQLDCAPKDCWYIGDSKADVLASRAAGLQQAIIALYGYIPNKQTAQNWGADQTIDHPLQLKNLIR